MSIERIGDANNKEDYKIYGELITANIYRIEKGVTELQVKTIIVKNNPKY